MARKARAKLPTAKPDEAPPAPEDDSPAKDKPSTIENWAEQPDSDIYEEVLKFYPLIQKAYENRDEADQAIEEYWHIFNAEPDDNQMYAGNSKCYIPAVRDALGARTKRALKQLLRRLRSTGATAK